MKHPIRGTHKTHRSHVSGSRRAIRFAARRKDALIQQAARIERSLKTKEPPARTGGPNPRGDDA